MHAAIRTTAAALAVLTAIAAAVAFPQPERPPSPAPFEPTLPPPPVIPPVGEVPTPWPYPQRLAMVQRNVLVRTEGRLDHMDYDATSRRLYIAAIAKGALEVHGAADSTLVQSIELPAPTDVLVLADPRRVLVTCEGDNSLRVFARAEDGTLTPERSVVLPATPGTIALDAARGRVFVGHGQGVSEVDPATGKLGTPIDVGGEVEGMVVEPAGAPARLFACVPSKHAVVVIDTAASRVLAEWKIPEDEAAPGVVREWNYPLALDAEAGRLFVVTRVPAELHVLDTATGTRVARVERVCQDADDCWYDPTTRRVLISGGAAGGVTLVRRNDGDAYSLEATITTATGARTSCLSVPERRLFVGAPAFGDDQAYVFVYLIGPR
jgi:hypothetical protein